MLTNKPANESIRTGETPLPQPRLLRHKQFIKNNAPPPVQLSTEAPGAGAIARHREKEAHEQEDDLEDGGEEDDDDQAYLQCHICDKRIKRKYHFHRHLRTHSGEKQHQCPVCKYRSVRKDNLKSHMKTHRKHIDLIAALPRGSLSRFMDADAAATDDAISSVLDDDSGGLCGGGEEVIGSLFPFLMASDEFLKRCIKAALFTKSPHRGVLPDAGVGDVILGEDRPVAAEVETQNGDRSHQSLVAAVDVGSEAAAAAAAVAAAAATAAAAGVEPGSSSRGGLVELTHGF